jgi:membrane protein implicated in regulation of membrane protease activity
MDFFLAPENYVFMAILAIIAVLAFFEFLALFVGISIFGHTEANVDVDNDVDFDLPLLEWIGIGQIPLLAYSLMFAGTFSIFGLLSNLVSKTVIGNVLNFHLAGSIAIVLTFLVIGKVVSWFKKIVPKDESYAINKKDLLGSEATVLATISNGNSVPAFCSDCFGTIHNISVKSFNPNQEIPERSKVRLENLSDQGFFYVSLIV